MTDSEFVKQLLKRRADNKQRLAQHLVEYAQQERAIALLLASEGHTSDDEVAGATMRVLDRDSTLNRIWVALHASSCDTTTDQRLGDLSASRDRLVNNCLTNLSNFPSFAATKEATTRDFVRLALEQAGGPMKMADVVEAVERMGSDASPDTVRSVLQKLLHSGEAERPDRGLYALKTKPEPERTNEDELDLSLGLMEVEPSP